MRSITPRGTPLPREPHARRTSTSGARSRANDAIATSSAATGSISRPVASAAACTAFESLGSAIASSSERPSARSGAIRWTTQSERGINAAASAAGSTSNAGDSPSLSAVRKSSSAPGSARHAFE